jgi:hypothetical protein
MIWKELGNIIIIPTLSVSIYISYSTRKLSSDLAHNLAVEFWISAKRYWIISEIFGYDETRIWSGYEGKQIAMIPFLIGLVILAWYYLFQRTREIKNERLTTM